METKDKIVIIGGGGHAKVLISVLKKNNDYSIIGYTDMKDHGNILGVEYLGDDSVLEKLIKDNICTNAALGIGQIDTADVRLNVINKLTEIGFEFPSVVSNKSIVNEDVTIGKGSVVFDGAVINSGSKIGEFSIINTGALIEHDCEIGDHTHIAPGSVLCGGVQVGSNTMIGAGSTVIQSKKVSANIIVGAGAVVTKDCSEQGVYAGVPARRIK